MVSNFTEDLGTNTAVSVSIFFIIILPTFILCLLYLLTLFFADGINWLVRVPLINILAAEIPIWAALTLLFLGYPARALTMSDDNFSCNFAISLLVVNIVQKFSSIALYSIVVYITIKYGTDNLKRNVIVLYITTSWFGAIAISVVVGYYDQITYNDDGFCIFEVDSRNIFFRAVLAIMEVAIFVLYCTILAFSVLTGIYIKKNTPLLEMKKEIVKLLLYFNIVTVSAVAYNLTPLAVPPLREAFPNDESISIIIIHSILRVFLNLPTLLSPIAVIAISTPIRCALKRGFEKGYQRASSCVKHE